MVNRLSLRTKLVASLLFVVIAGGLLSSLIGTRLVGEAIVSQARARVKSDLNTAWLIYSQALERVRDVVQLTAAGRTPPELLESRQWKKLEEFLAKRCKDFGLDLLTLTDARGRVLVRTHHPFLTGDDQSSDPLVQRALKGEAVASTVIVPREELEKERSDLAERAFLVFVPTPKAKEVAQDRETAGMMLKAACPVWNGRGRLAGVLYGGVLLNRDYRIVDKVRDLLYGEGRYEGKEMGTATILQGDLRISTNVLDEKGQRAVGTRLSEEVRRAVLEKGEVWLDRAFVVHDWYLTGYQPIRDLAGKIVGILYVGILEAPYVDLRNKVVYSFFALAVLGVVIVVLLYFFITSRITRPLRDMAAAAAKIAEGDLSVEVAGRSQDEIGLLAQSFNHMLVRLKQARKELEDYGRSLEAKVEERTRELVKMQDHLIQSEKLASMGQLAASIAHEVNNPLSGVLIYNQLLTKKISRGEFDRDAILDYLAKMEHELSRSTKLIRSLLDFGVQSEPKIREVNVNEVLSRALDLAIHAGAKENTRVEKDLQPLPTFMVDPDQLEQVFVNLILNALQAMPRGGTLTLRTWMESRELKVAVKDTGCGIPPENLGKIFTPFFSTKKEVKGVGLGLSVSYGIIQGLKGRIEVQSKVGEGTTFTVCLPIAKE